MIEWQLFPTVERLPELSRDCCLLSELRRNDDAIVPF